MRASQCFSQPLQLQGAKQECGIDDQAQIQDQHHNKIDPDRKVKQARRFLLTDIANSGHQVSPGKGIVFLFPQDDQEINDE
jgi:hypothetical protein